MGEAFLQAEGVFPTELLVAKVELNADGLLDLIVVQKALCSNHACSFELLLNRGNGGWTHVSSIDS